MGIRSSVEEWAPEKASKALDRARDAVKNRNISDAHVEWIASQMKSRKWEVNGEPLIFDDDNCLMDGQHRLYAVALNGVTVQMLTVRGVPRKSFATIDTGKGRTIGNVMSIHGEKYSNVVSAALGWLHCYNEGKMLWRAKAAGMTAPIAVSLLRKNPEMREAVEWAAGAVKNPILRRVSPSALGFLRFMFTSHKPYKATEFFELVMDVRADQPGTPTRVLRNWILTKDQVRRAQKVTTAEVMAIIVKGWTAFLNGAKPTKYLWRRAGDNPEDFPRFPGDRESAGKALRASKKTKKGKTS